MSLLVILFQVLRVACQVAFPSWNLTLTASSVERVSLAGAALDVTIDRLSPDGLFDAEGAAALGLAGNLYSQMVEFDIATNQTKYQSILEEYFQLVEPLRTNFSDTYVGDELWTVRFIPLLYTLDSNVTARSFGHAAAKAYMAYNNSVFLQYAIQSWWFGSGRTISASDIAAGKIAGKKFTLATACGNVTMTGGTYWNNDSADANVAGVGTGYFLVLSALLAEATSDSLYLEAANQSADFIRLHLYDALDIVQQYISTASGTGCQLVTDTIAPTNSGLMMEGLSILHSITNDTSTQNLLGDLIVAVIPNTGWQGNNGIVNPGDMNLLQGLGTVYARNSVNATLRQYVGDYIAVQFNAVTNLATSSGTNIYGSSWTGPPSDIFSGSNQTIALGALISAIRLETTPSSPTTPSTSTSSPVTSQSRSRHLGAILGGTFGALAFVVILTVTWIIHRQHSRILAPILTLFGRVSEVTPFTAEPSVVTSSSSQNTGLGQREKRGDYSEPPHPAVDTAQGIRLPNIDPRPIVVKPNSNAVLPHGTAGPNIEPSVAEGRRDVTGVP
ncbi:Glycoside hydrolase family 76 protein [Mycena sanguinolenta]|uniref:Glycoside hydrolase family 76 protein n=1 Tax=Mycena sanguinolenta TaxID=230812 RepID=A0A8H6X3B8_9AGAR|nr:Glycoside hydrolase family 76 protein [Mycena sanguinolenta]